MLQQDNHTKISCKFEENNVVIRELSEKEVISIYTTYSVLHFPAAERKPVSAIAHMTAAGTYKGYGLYHEEQLLCYALFAVLPDRQNILLDYLAVLEEYRSLGIGTLFLNHMRKNITEYNGFLIEVENPDYAKSSGELSIRKKRIDFYYKNEAYFTGILAEIFEVFYRVLYFPILEKPPVKTLFEDFTSIYANMVPAKYHDTSVHIYLPETCE